MLKLLDRIFGNKRSLIKSLKSPKNADNIDTINDEQLIKRKKIAKIKKYRRHKNERKMISWHFIQAIGSANSLLMLCVLLLVGSIAGLRYFVNTDTGRQNIENFFNGLPLGPIGHLEVAGLKGDFLTEFNLKYAAIKDEKGIWIDGNDFHVKWDAIDLARRLVHIRNVNAKLIKMYRLPVLRFKGGHIDKIPVGVLIDIAQSPVETSQELSIKRGLWGAAAKIDINRKIDTKINGKIINAYRFGDYATVDLLIKRGLPLHSFISAKEENGGAISGILGLNPDLPLYINSRIESRHKKGLIDIYGRSGAQEFAQIKGEWNEKGGDINGNLNFAASKLTEKLAQRFGQEVKINSDWHGENLENQDFKFDLAGGNLDMKLSGNVDFIKKSANHPMDLAFNVKSLSDFSNNPKILGGVGALVGKLNGSIDDLHFLGAYKINGFAPLGMNFTNILGNVELIKGKKDTVINMNYKANDGLGNNIIAKLLGANPHGNFAFIMSEDGRKIFDELNIYGYGLEFIGKAKKSLIWGNELKGRAKINTQIITNNIINGLINFDISASQSRQLAYSIDIDAAGSGLKSQFDFINKLLGSSQNLKANLNIADNKPYFTNISINGDDVELKGQGNALAANPLNINGNIRLGDRILNLAKLSGSTSGTFVLKPNDNSGAQFDFDLIGKNLDNNVLDIKKYFGDATNITGSLLINNKAVNIANAKIIGKTIKLFDINGALIGAKDIAIVTKWSALGPVAAGPLQINGNLSGNGTIMGTWSAPKFSLFSQVQQLNIGNSIITPAIIKADFVLDENPFNMAINIDGKSEFGAIEGSSNLVAVTNGVEINNININGAGVKIIGSADILQKQSLNAELSFNIGQGLFLQNGTISGSINLNPNRKNILSQIIVTGRNFSPRGSQLQFKELLINGGGTLSNMLLDTKFLLQSPVQTNFNGRTQVSFNDGKSQFLIVGQGVTDNRQFLIDEPFKVKLANGAQNIKGKIKFIGQKSEALGFANIDIMHSDAKLIANLDAKDLNLAFLNRDFSGSFSGNAKLENQGNKLFGYFRGDLNNAKARGLANNMALDGQIDAKLQDEMLNLDVNLKNNQGLDVDLQSILPAITNLNPLRLAIYKDGAISGNYNFKGEIRPLAELVFAGERTLAGNINANGQLNGTINKPQIDGVFSLDKGLYNEPEIGLNLNNLNVKGRIDKDILIIDNLKSSDAKHGELNANGEIGLNEGGGSNLKISTRKFILVDNDLAKIESSGNLQLSSIGLKSSSLTGQMRVDFAEFSPKALAGKKVISLDVEEINIPQNDDDNYIQTPSKTKKINSKIGNNTNIDVKINSPRGIFIRGSGLNLELSLDANVSGTLSSPKLDGLARVYRGEYEYGGRTFAFEDRGTINLSEKPEQIRLNLLASRKTNNLTANINIGGTAKEPKVTLSSVPSLPPDEILAQVLFGRARAQLSPFETVQLASSLASLAAGDAFDVMANLREFVRLDRLVFGNTTTGEISIAGGKYLGRDVYLEIISQGTQGISTNVEWRPIPSTAIISKVGQSGDAKISIRWRGDIK